jgi:DnaJ-class molecular chaperone
MFGQTKSNHKYYDILGVTKDSKEEDIKKAYKKMAIKYHPDRNQDNKEEAEKKFAEINEAYSTLSDSKKRQQYNMFGTSSGGSVDPMNTFQMFNNIFQRHVSEFINKKTDDTNSFSNILNELNNNKGQSFPFGGIRFKVNTFSQNPPPKKQTFQKTKNYQYQNRRPRPKPYPTPKILLKPKEQIVNKSFEIKDVYDGITKETEIDLIRRTKNNKGQIIYNKIKKKFNIPLKGREIFIENWGNHLRGYKKPADLLLMINDLPNDIFKRFNDYDLFKVEKIEYEKLPKNNSLSIKLPNDKEINVDIDIKELLKDTNKLIKIENKGFPYIIDNELKRGNLYIKIEIIINNYELENKEEKGDIKCEFVKMFDVF